ncbi:MAG: oxygen-independent coproporphyrinogen III oxidase [Porticoccaceae bacterium]
MNTSASVLWDERLIQRYDLAGPRYTSYPTALQFHDAFSARDLQTAIEQSPRRASPLSFYVHIPFCSRVCYYCACNKIITANRRVAAPYIARLEKELAMVAPLVERTRPVRQLHWGGGTPTYISDDEKRQLMAAIREHFTLLDDDSGEYAIEVHPGDTTEEGIRCLRELGFNRLSLGVQDFDADVQRAVNRFNTVAEVSALVTAARELGFHSIGMDLIYGLPRQSTASFSRTLDQVIALAPDRLSIFNYAHMPQMFKNQRHIDERALPPPQEKLAMLRLTIERMLAAGYIYIGMDHFAKPDDALALAQREGRLQRNFQGYATHGGCDLLAFGVSAISAVGNTYCQNHRDITAYSAAIDRGALPLARGLMLTDDDRLRAWVIEQLICHFRLDFAAVERMFSINVGDYFGHELRELSVMADDGLVRLSPAGIDVTPAGRLLIRRICMVFDAWLRAANEGQRFSRII